MHTQTTWNSKTDRNSPMKFLAHSLKLWNFLKNLFTIWNLRHLYVPRLLFFIPLKIYRPHFILKKWITPAYTIARQLFQICCPPLTYSYDFCENFPNNIFVVGLPYLVATLYQYLMFVFLQKSLSTNFVGLLFFILTIQNMRLSILSRPWFLY